MPDKSTHLSRHLVAHKLVLEDVRKISYVCSILRIAKNIGKSANEGREWRPLNLELDCSDECNYKRP